MKTETSDILELCYKRLDDITYRLSEDGLDLHFAFQIHQLYDQILNSLASIDDNDPLYSEVVELKIWVGFNQTLEDLHVELDRQHHDRRKILRFLDQVGSNTLALKDAQVLEKYKGQFVGHIRKLYARLKNIGYYKNLLELLNGAQQVVTSPEFEKDYQTTLKFINTYQTSLRFNEEQIGEHVKEEEAGNQIERLEELLKHSPSNPELIILFEKAQKTYNQVKARIEIKIATYRELMSNAQRGRHWEDVREQANLILFYRADDVDAKSAKAEADYQQNLIKRLRDVSAEVQKSVRNGSVLEALRRLNGVLQPIIYPNPYEIVREMTELRDSLRWLLPHWKTVIELVENQQDYSLALDTLNDILEKIDKPIPTVVASLLAQKKQELRYQKTPPEPLDEITRSLNVFICYASQDKQKVRILYNSLRDKKWIRPWLDKEEILAGQDFDTEIQRALRQSDVIIVCLSKASIHKEGYIQKEFKQALDISKEKPKGEIFIIPLRLDECNVPDDLNNLQWLDYFSTDSKERLMKALKERVKSLKRKTEQ